MTNSKSFSFALWILVSGCIPGATGGSSVPGATATAMRPLPSRNPDEGTEETARSRHQLLPTGDLLTPLASPGSTLLDFDPGLPGVPGFRADHATSTVTSPDGKTLLVLTSGYNETKFTPAENQANPGGEIASESGEWIFVYDISGNRAPVETQVLRVPNSFAGIAFNPSGTEFYAAGGRDDNVHVFDRAAGNWVERIMPTDAGTAPAPIELGHSTALGLSNYPQAAGVAVTRDGARLIVANYENDSISIVDLATKTVAAELDLRPGKSATSPTPGVAGGEYPFWVVVRGSDAAYVSSQRDREVDVVALAAPEGGSVRPAVTRRIPVGGQPNKASSNESVGEPRGLG
jgi:YVTN family beta-propeller protein